MKSALNSVLDNTSGINAGLMRYSLSDNGGRIIFPILPIDTQLCDGQPCDEARGFNTQSRVKHSQDDAFQPSNGPVNITDNSLQMMSGESSWVGLRFSELDIPQGATITDARLDLTSTSSNDSSANFSIYSEDTTDAEPFTATGNNISNRSRHFDSVSWNSVPAWENNQQYESPNIASLVQKVVDKTDWCGGNALSLLISGTGNRLIDSFDKSTVDSPVLRVTYTLADVPENGGCTSQTIVKRVASNDNDAMQLTYPGFYNGYMYRGYGFHIIRSSNSYYSGFSAALAFDDIDLPANAEIIEATLAVNTRSSGYNSGNLTVNISAENNGNPSAIGYNWFNISNRPRVASSVGWNSISSTVGVTSESPNIKSLLDDIIENPDWQPGNRMVFILEPGTGSGQRAIASNESGTSNSARLKIRYKTYISNAASAINGPVSTVRTKLKEHVDEMVAYHGTPTVGALLEAGRYFSGSSVDYGKKRYVYASSRSGNGRYSRVSHPDSYTGGTVSRSNSCYPNALNGWYCATEQITGNPIYKSPITDECQTNHIVLLTDGEPTADSIAIDKVKALTSAANPSNNSCTAQNYNRGTCGEEMAEYLYTVDQHSSNGKQFITTHTIGFNLDIPWLERLSTAGGGGHYTADTADQLQSAFNTILDEVQDVNTSFVAPGATVDHFTKLSHRNDVYLALFKPKKTPEWEGNLKRYDIAGTPPRLKDVHGNNAVDPETGQFYSNARSKWTADTINDGNSVGLGGAAGRLNHTTRDVLTNISDNADLTAESNIFSKNNDAITTNALGISATDTVRRANILDWSRGVDLKDENGDGSTSDTRFHIGDPLHSRPVIVTYSGSSTNPNSAIFFGTNEGFLHSIDTESGDEIFSFIPKDLLPNLNVLYGGNPAHDKPYGLDGPISIWREDKNHNGTIETGDHVYIYVGMRRGGNSYYSLDVSEKDSPKFRWQITNSDEGFSELGQTWSQPIVTTINYLGTPTKVLIFGGGYDDSQDDKDTRGPDTVGRAIYIVNASDKTLLWSGGHSDGNPTKEFSDMTFSIPASVQVIDGDGNGTTEQFYVGDMGGRIWRFDIDESATTQNSLVNGGIIADLASDNDASETRRFYHTPDISVTVAEGKFVANIAIGSGYQAHPLNKTIDDRFYLIRYPQEANDDNEYGMFDTTTNAYRAIKESDLFNATSNILGEGDETEIAAAEAELLASQGWLIEMETSGEKILGPSVTFNNRVMFTSYIPGGISTGCAPQLGTGVFWAVDLWDARPVENFDDIDPNTTPQKKDLVKADRNKLIPGTGIPAPIQTLLIKLNDTITITTTSGAHVMMQDTSETLVERTYWSETPDF
ncbi:hypothetical protein AB833_22035 [Chromatiales bacterium (ex Bugula neritina AB1)]|nr:hypothetical protein AB833_22035 [Chromatiales bacterium (ex Bugula neritina AB1)]